jgi:hypothetical protein
MVWLDATAIDDAGSLGRSYPSVLGSFTGFTVLGLSDTSLRVLSIPDHPR